MLFAIEFGKLFRRKFNYLFIIILSLINFAFVYKTRYVGYVLW